MSRVELDTSIGYALKRAQNALRAAMDHELRKHGLTVPQYSCLEQLDQRPGQSNAQLAQGTFVTRQAMHQLLGGLRSAGLVTAAGPARRTQFSCTQDGLNRLHRASRAIAAVEERMLRRLSAADRRRLLADLNTCANALSEAAEPP